MIENNRQLAGAIFQMESFADTLEEMRRTAQQAEPSVFAVTPGGFVHLLRERIAEIKAYVETLPDTQPQSADNRTAADSREQALTRNKAA